MYPYPASALFSDDALSLLKILGKHFVSMLVVFETSAGQRQVRSYSAFVASFMGTWHFLTAGHCVLEMKELKAHGYVIVAWDVNDAFAGGPYFRSFTVELRLEDWVYSYSEFDPSGPDIASVPIDPFHLRTLRANGIRPLDLTADLERLSGTPFDRMGLVGVPAEKTVQRGDRVNQFLFCIPVRPLEPFQVVEKLRSEERRMFGQIESDEFGSSGITTIAGTSGGPVFGFWISDDRSTFDYAAVGIQSGWDPASKQIAAWPLDELSAALAYHQALIESGQNPA